MNLLTEVYQVNLRVSDMKRAVKWYQDVLGLKVQKDYGNTVVLGISESSGTPAAVCLIEHPEKGVQSFDDNVTHPVLAISPGQAEACREKLRQMGARIIEGGGKAHFKFADPDGNLLEAYLPNLYKDEKYEHLR
ncbi:VOC family protein [Virgibacillus kekensis]|uniref:VOC family protein n=1 Tax=Virgibacillus kekensis TaxID=202261 RepID=A0ABV9DMY8_9BACI